MRLRRQRAVTCPCICIAASDTSPMPISTRPTRPKHFRTAIFVFSLLSSAHVCAKGVTPVSSTACGVRVDAPANVVLRADTDAPQPLCVLRIEAGAASPFVNTVVTMPFSRLDQLRVDGVALREIGFFHIARGNVTYRRQAVLPGRTKRLCAARCSQGDADFNHRAGRHTPADRRDRIESQMVEAGHRRKLG